jgi:predicted amidohydrolase
MLIRVRAVQTGPATDDVEVNLANAAAAATAPDGPVDIIVFPELYAHPFWCLGDSDPFRFSWAERLDGPTVRSASQLARDAGAVVIAPFFERGAVEGEYYNSAVVIGPDGSIVEGTLPTGKRVRSYRKNAISAYRWGDEVNDEKFYFRLGDGFAVFDTPKGRIGVLICLDRWFPEAWRVLALAGADIVCVANASQGAVSDMFQPSMRTCAAQHLVYAVAVNRAGLERFGAHSINYYGQSCIVDPFGTVLASADLEPCAIDAQIDLGTIARARAERTMYRDRRPELYGLITEVGR